MNPSQIVTLLTAITFFLGIYSVHYSQIHGYIISLLITVAISYVFPQFNHLRRSELFKCLVTSLIFGIINSYYIHKYF